MFGHDDDHKQNNNGQGDHQDDAVKAVTSDDGWQHPDLSPAASSDDGGADKPADQENDQAPSAGPAVHPGTSDAQQTHHGGNDLIDLKQQALTKLSPLVDKLDQSPGEKFRTLMMMIQASDNQKLVRQAYEVALEIHDEKERAQALLDIVNEINYFTQNPSDSSDE